MTTDHPTAPEGRFHWQVDATAEGEGIVTAELVKEETALALMLALHNLGWDVRPYQNYQLDQLIRSMLNAAGIDSRTDLSDTQLVEMLTILPQYKELEQRLRPDPRLGMVERATEDPDAYTDNLETLLIRQKAWSQKTFGPGPRTAGVLAHIRKELLEVEENPTDVTEWIDVVILALDGAWRAGHTPTTIVHELNAKYEKNRNREWPDWRNASEDQPIEHVRDDDPVCRDCGRDNRNSTHDALESTGHLSHSFNPAPHATPEQVEFLHRGDHLVPKHAGFDAWVADGTVTDSNSYFKGWDAAVAALLNEVVRLQTIAQTPGRELSVDDNVFFSDHVLGAALTVPTRAALMHWLESKAGR